MALPISLLPVALKVPTLVIRRERGTALLTGNLEGIDQLVPRLTGKRIAGGSHCVVHEKPALANGYIRDVLP